MSDLTDSLEVPEYLLPDVISVLKPTSTKDSSGFQIKNYQTTPDAGYGDLPASIQPGAAVTREQSGQLKMVILHEVYVLTNPGIKAGQVLRDERTGKFLRVLGVFNPGNQSVFWTITAEEVTSGAA